MHPAPTKATAEQQPATASNGAAAAAPTASVGASVAAPTGAAASPSAEKAADPGEKLAAGGNKLPTDLQFDEGLSAADWAAIKVPVGSVSLAKLDLNLDGKPDYVVVDRKPEACGSSGCSTTVYVSSGTQWVKGLDLTTRYITVSDVVTNGAHEIITEDVTRWIWQGKNYELGERWQPGCVKQAELKEAKPPVVRKADKKEVARRFGTSFDSFAEKQPQMFSEIMDESGVSEFMMFGGVVELVRLSNGTEILLLGGQGPHVEGYKRRTVAYDIKRHQAMLLIDTGTCNQKQFGRGDSDVQAILYAFTARYDNL